MPRTTIPSSPSSAAPATPVRPGSRPTSTASAPRSRATRATLTPLPPGVTAARSKRSTSPGRSSSIVRVRSMVRLGPAMTTARDPSTRRPASDGAYDRAVSAAYRLNRLFHAGSGRCIDVAVDHGFFGEPRFLAGIEDMAGVIETLVGAAPDAIQLSVGQAPLLQAIPGREKPALVLRVDVANVYGEQPPRHAFSHTVDHAIGHAVRPNATCACANFFDLPGPDAPPPDVIANLTALRTAD